MAKKMKAQVEVKPISAKELKFWLEGILEFQAKDWVPNAEQWKGIQEKIFNLEDVPPQIIQQFTGQAPVQASVHNVFAAQQPPGGGTGQPVTGFPSFTPAFDTVIPNLPVRDANGFLKDPNDIMASNPTIQSSGANKTITTGSFE